MKKHLIGIGIALGSMAAACASFNLSITHELHAANYSTNPLPTTIDLNDTSETDIRSYYLSMESLAVSERTGENLLKTLKPILKNNQKYYNYDSGDSVWKLYEIADRDWDLSPATELGTYGNYDTATNTITNYQYGSNSNSKGNPYLHSLYVNREVENPMRAWGNHTQSYGGINREHIWPKSHGFYTESRAGGARGDPMHLWSADGYTNNIHSNYYYGYVDKTKSYTDCGNNISYANNNLRGTSLTIGSGTVFEPQDCDKGDIARACFYMAARYNNIAGDDTEIDQNNPNLKLDNVINGNTGTSTATNAYSLGLVSDLLEWNRLDPPDEWEIHRNNLLYTNFTSNRNPFIDFPEWADYIWGDKAGTGIARPSTDMVNRFNDGGGDPTPDSETSFSSAASSSSETPTSSETPASSDPVTSSEVPATSVVSTSNVSPASIDSSQSYDNDPASQSSILIYVGIAVGIVAVVVFIILVVHGYKVKVSKSGKITVKKPKNKKKK